MERWRCCLFGVFYSEPARAEEREKEKAGGQVQVFRQRISREKALEVLHEGGRLKRIEYMRCRVRYLNDGAVLGSKDFWMRSRPNLDIGPSYHHYLGIEAGFEVSL